MAARCHEGRLPFSPLIHSPFQEYVLLPLSILVEGEFASTSIVIPGLVARCSREFARPRGSAPRRRRRRRDNQSTYSTFTESPAARRRSNVSSARSNSENVSSSPLESGPSVSGETLMIFRMPAKRSSAGRRSHVSVPSVSPSSCLARSMAFDLALSPFGGLDQEHVLPDRKPILAGGLEAEIHNRMSGVPRHPAIIPRSDQRFEGLRSGVGRTGDARSANLVFARLPRH